MAFGVSACGCSEVVKLYNVYKDADRKIISQCDRHHRNSTCMTRLPVRQCISDQYLLGMAVDAEKRRPVLSTITGMSGAAVKPIALRMVWQVAKAVNIPVIGLGYHGMEGCCGVYASRCHRNTDRYCQLHRSSYYCQSFRRNK